MKTLLLSVALFCLSASGAFSQAPVPDSTAAAADTAQNAAAQKPAKVKDSDVKPRIAVKLNAPILVGIVNPAVEFSVHKHFTIDFEVLGCFYKNLNTSLIKGDVVVATAFLEPRYYPKNKFRGFFVGPNIGFGVWDLTKGVLPMYWGTYPNEYQIGRNLMVGITLGYVFSIKEHWGIELSVGGGRSWARYEGHVRQDGSMYIGDNGSAEWLPYKGACSVIYKW